MADQAARPWSLGVLVREPAHPHEPPGPIEFRGLREELTLTLQELN